MNIIVTGSRNFTDPDFVFRKLDKLTAKLTLGKFMIFTRHNPGVERMAEDWCFRKLVAYKIFHEDSEAERMAREADVLVAFRDGKRDRETDNLIKLAKKHGTKIREINCKEKPK